MGAPGRLQLTSVLALVALAACSTTAPETGPAGESPSLTPTPPASATPSPSAAAATPPPPIRIAVAGDIHFEGILAGRLRDPATALLPVRPSLARADLTIVNLETSVGTGGRPAPGKRFAFSAGPAAFEALAAAGVDVVAMANNHALDYGRARLPSTLRAARAAQSADPSLEVVGIGRNLDDAFRPALSEVGVTLVATISASVADQDPAADPTSQGAATHDLPGTADAMDPTRLLTEIRRADRAADVVVAYLHWGIQGEGCPSADQRSLAARLVGAGADLVVGSHAHQLQGDGRLRGGYVAYGLGNFVWYAPGSGATSRTGVLTLTVQPPQSRADRARVVRTAWDPGSIGPAGLPRAMDDAATADFRANREVLRDCSGLSR